MANNFENNQFDFQFLVKQSNINLLEYPDWINIATSELVTTLNQELFPCVFARRANNLENLLFAFIETDICTEYTSNYDLESLLNTLLEYTRFCKEIIAKDRLYFPLILIFNFQLDTLEASQNKAWEILKQIFQFNQDNFNDEDVLNPNQAGWKFRFNGVNLFFNINHPQHILHKSRNVNSYLTMVVNPSENFLIVAPVVNGERKISNLIRDRVKQYNNGIIADTLSINDDTKPDWKQYQHEEGNVKLPLICPFSNMEKSKC